MSSRNENTNSPKPAAKKGAAPRLKAHTPKKGAAIKALSPKQMTSAEAKANMARVEEAKEATSEPKTFVVVDGEDYQPDAAEADHPLGDVNSPK